MQDLMILLPELAHLVVHDENDASGLIDYELKPRHEGYFQTAHDERPSRVGGLVHGDEIALDVVPLNKDCGNERFKHLTCGTLPLLGPIEEPHLLLFRLNLT